MTRHSPWAAPFLLAFACISWLVSGPVAFAAPEDTAHPIVHIHGESTLSVHTAASPLPDQILFAGRLADDNGRGLARERVTLSSPDRSGGWAVILGDCPGLASYAPPDRGAGPLEAGAVKTNDDGSFCVAATALTSRSAPATRLHLVFAWAGTRLVDRTSADVVAYLDRASVELNFAGLPDPPVIPLDRDLHVAVRAELPAWGETQAATGISLALTNEKDVPLAPAAKTNEAGEAEFDVPRALLGPPGPGELRLTFPGGAFKAPATRTARIERRAIVVLSQEGDVAEGDPEDGLEIAVSARTTAGAPVPAGLVEAIVGGATAGVAPVGADGKARVTATFAADGPSAQVELRYRSDVPWYVAKDVPLTVVVAVKAGSPWRKVSFLAAGLAVLLWLALGRARSPLPTAEPPADTGPRVARPRVDVVRLAPDDRSPWTGEVVDAHEGTAIDGAELHIERRSFAATTRVAGARSGADGRFVLRCEAPQRDDVLVVEHAFFAPLALPLPPRGEVKVALVTRKRKLLDRLVRWARRRGAPYDRPPEPTPAHVARAAQAAQGGEPLAAWAGAVERAAFGPGAVDAETERAVSGLGPDEDARR